ncbi:hypothetical protein CRM22_009262 [Opisthorchis felineus]|uniref:UVR domain-containing protein n=1 Tax=Opisthorchis felineus TaxID=147828 RepID=A0A4S2LEK4_OPIFE|nr:hypothetical protein CRM22_009262 [Opisthorchis felineus]TGZ59085.1 hypothetical protein CRM22_009262 [Opisthorchis felineus]TGZ59086.1 hypothetical protein CRM22_009262 [Opisthorchis felineus]TGZ59087.1 hypothetical protein CRM22_009262 [Opisthorchis felineus]TGZ59089.1 hypothetical protein CRM22_009262 [Opisthorchis felineus]
MPHKLPFRVVHVSSQDEKFPVEELNRHSPATRGWVSSRFCPFPQKLVLSLERHAHLRKIQVLCHQYMIPTRVEFFVGTPLECDVNHFRTARYVRLGYVSLSDNESTEFKARELKSVHLDTCGSYIQLLLHRNYPNRYNVYNQVGIIAVNLIGSFTGDSSEIDPEAFNMHAYRYDFIPPTEDLAFDIYQDPEVADIIRRLEKLKQTAVLQERFDRAQKIRDSIGMLQQVGERLGRLNLEKQEAIEVENYERAKLKKYQIDELRSTMFEDLDLMNLLADIPSEADFSEPQFHYDAGRPAHVRLSTLDAVINPSKENLDHSIRHSDVKTSEQKICTCPPADPDERPLPALRISSQNNSAAVESYPSDHVCYGAHPNESSEPESKCMHMPVMEHLPTVDEAQEVREMEELQELRAKKVVEKRPFEVLTQGPTPAEISEGPEQLSENARRQASVAIDVVGLDLVTKALSKCWSFREQALVELEKRVTAPKLPPPVSAPDMVDPDPRAELRSTTFLLKRALQDQVLSIFRLATYFIKGTIVDFADRHSILRVELHYALDKLIPILFQRIGDTSARIREVAKSQILSMAQWPQLRHNATFWNELLRPFSSVTLDRLALSRMELVTELYAARGLDSHGPEHTHGFTLDAVAAFTAKALTHRSKEVREASENLMVALYRSENRAVIRHAMPPEDINAHRHPLYRRLFGKFERIDEKYSPSEVHSGASPQRTPKGQKKPEAHQVEVKQLRSIMSNRGKKSVPSKPSNQRPHTPETAVKPATRFSPQKSTKRGRKKVRSPPSRPDSRSNKSKSRERASPLPPQSAQLVAEAELMLHLDKTCIFCGEQNDSFTEEGLDLHYWRDCPMLHRCPDCKQVVEIASTTDHLLNECEAAPPGHYTRCDVCSEAVPEPELKTHACLPSTHSGLRCPLCHSDLPAPGSTDVAPGGPEDIWKSHLLGLDQANMPVCSKNPRRTTKLKKAIHLGSHVYQSPQRSDSKNRKDADKMKTGIPRPTNPIHIR